MTEPRTGLTAQSLAELTADIVAAYVSNHIVQIADLPTLIIDVKRALTNFSLSPEPPRPALKPKPAVSIRRSIENDYLICLEDGKKFRSLKRHLMVQYNLTPDAYREKWGLPAEYPMVAPAYAEVRSRLARNIRFGHRLIAKK